MVVNALILGNREWSISEILSFLIFSRLAAEIWDLETLSNRIIEPTLSFNDYRELALFMVDKDYCEKSFCVRIQSGLDHSLCSKNNHKAEDWAGSELKVI